ncbi:MAG: cation transporter [Nanoarchaeota archaeon]
MKKIFKIEGMHCESCKKIIEMELQGKVNKISVNLKENNAEVDFDERKINDRQIAQEIIKLGYKVRK